MFSDAVPGYRAPDEARRQARQRSLGVVDEAVQACLDTGALTTSEAVDAEDIAHLCWAAVHGLVTLELSGHTPPETADRRFALLPAVLDRFRPE
jgi:hypothetical protein